MLTLTSLSRPELGQHNDEIYSKLLALTPERYAALKAAAVI
jgi:crotonobetainyl-CoA:carnitine CoA-transferase CaiB-like acyl-CoA transferase